MVPGVRQQGESVATDGRLAALVLGVRCSVRSVTRNKSVPAYMLKPSQTVYNDEHIYVVL